MWKVRHEKNKFLLVIQKQLRTISPIFFPPTSMTPRVEIESSEVEQPLNLAIDHAELTELRQSFGHMLTHIGWQGGSAEDELMHLRTFRSIYTNDIPD